MKKKLTKSKKNRVFGGVCGGLAEYFNIDATLVRIITVILACLGGPGLIAYFIIWLIMPNAEITDEEVENLKSANVNNDSEEKNDKKEGRSDSEFNDCFKK